MTEPMRRTHGTLPCPVAWQASARPDAPALVAPGRVQTYAELDLAAAAVAAGLRASGVAPGSYVGVYLSNDVAFITLFVALLRLGAVMCPISTRYPERGVRDALARVRASHLVTRDAAVGAGAAAAVLDPDALLATPPPQAQPWPRLDVGRPATVVFTSGSTGTPKAALHTYGNHHYSALGAGGNMPLGPGDRWLLSLPLYHVGGLAVLVRCFTAGAAVVLPPRDAAPTDVIAPFGVTHASLVSTQLVRWLRTDVPPPPRLRAILLGGSAMPEDALRAAQARGLPVHTSYGLTEMASQVTTTPPGASLDVLRSSGRRLRHRALRIAADGEILVRGATLFAGYVEDAQVDPCVDVAGWFHTRDLGHIDGEGLLHVLGRRDHQFVSGGENIQPEEIEAALCALPGVEGAVVVPVDDTEFGARPVAFVRGVAGAAVALRAQLEAALPRFKLPIAFFDLPENPGMKPDRARLGREAAERLRRGEAPRGEDT